METHQLSPVTDSPVNTYADTLDEDDTELYEGMMLTTGDHKAYSTDH